jgi:hypothetical protein
MKVIELFASCMRRSRLMHFSPYLLLWLVSAEREAIPATVIWAASFIFPYNYFHVVYIGYMMDVYFLHPAQF